VRGMARGANGSVQGASLNGLSVHAAIELLRDGSVAHGAHVEGRLAKGPRVRPGRLVNVAMAKPAVRGRGVAGLNCLAVRSEGVFPRFLRMTRFAGWLWDPGWVGVLYVAEMAARTA